MSSSNNITVSFEIPNVEHGLKKAEGLIKLRDKGFDLEFKEEDAFVGMYKSEVETVHISYSDLKNIRFEKSWFSAKIVLEGNSMKVFEEVPGEAEAGSCILKIERKNRDEAQRLVSKARMQHSEYKLEQMDGKGTDD
jgi:hypothetical protein